MDNSKILLTNEELDMETKQGKGVDCDYWMAMCTIVGTIGGGSFDCGTCDWIYKECAGYTPTPPHNPGIGHGCTAH